MSQSSVHHRLITFVIKGVFSNSETVINGREISKIQCTIHFFKCTFYIYVQPIGKVVTDVPLHCHGRFPLRFSSNCDAQLTTQQVSNSRGKGKGEYT